MEYMVGFPERRNRSWAKVAAFGLQLPAFLVYILLSGFLLPGGCASGPGTVDTRPPTEAAEAAEVAGAEDDTQVSAVLFPYIPDAAHDQFASLIADLEAGFAAAAPGLTADVVINPEIDLYDLTPGGTLSTLLGDGPDAVDLVEVDTLLLGDLVARNWVQQLDLSGVTLPEILPTAWLATDVGGGTYGVPTYLCSNVIYDWDEGIDSVSSSGELVTFLTGQASEVPLVGNYSGSWTLPSTYVDAWADTHTNDPAVTPQSYDLPLDPPTMAAFSPVVDLCEQDGSNPCLDGTYSAGTEAEQTFAQGLANAFVGYSERLFFILSYNPTTPPSLISAPLGDGDQPMMFVDALVINPYCQGGCLSAALAFVEFMSTTAVRNLIAFSEDAPPGTVPRYLLQASTDFYAAQPAADNVVYQNLWAKVADLAQPYPNQGFPEAKDGLNTALEAALEADETALAPQFGPRDRGRAGQRLKPGSH